MRTSFVDPYGLRVSASQSPELPAVRHHPRTRKHPSPLTRPLGAGWRLRRYPGLKEDFYVASMVSGGAESLASRNWTPELPLLVLRPPPDLAMYHRIENTLWSPMLEYLASQREAEVLVVPRTAEQAARLAGQGIWRVHIADHAIAPATLLLHADGVVTAGGTMAREAAALGIPAYTVFAGRQGQVDATLIQGGSAGGAQVG